LKERKTGMDKNLVDTSGWLEYFTNGKNADFFAPAIEDIDNLIVSVINVYEIFKKVLAERGENAALETIAILSQGEIVEVKRPLYHIKTSLS
jgi:toxin FitB